MKSLSLFVILVCVSMLQASAIGRGVDDAEFDTLLEKLKTLYYDGK